MWTAFSLTIPSSTWLIAGTAQVASERLLQENPNLDGIFTPNESSTHGMLVALRSTKRIGKVKFVGFDGSEILIDALKRGQLHGLVLQDPFDMGLHGVRRALAYLEGKKPSRDTLHTNLQVATPANVDNRGIKAMYAPDRKTYLNE